MPTTRPSTAAHLTQPTIVPVSFVSNVILVSTVLGDKERATLLLDTGASQTAITPDMARQLGISPSDEAPRKTLVVFGGRKIEVPIVELSSIQVGDALVRNLKVGVSVINPKAHLVDGVLRGDFLRHFKVSVDRAASQLRLDPLSTLQSQVNEATPEKAISDPTALKRTSEEPGIRTQEKPLTYIPKKVKDAKIPTIKLRSTPKRVWRTDIEEMIRKYKFFVAFKNDDGDFTNDFVDNGDGSVTDRATGLMWQKGGSSSILRYKRAQKFVSRLNKERFLGHNDWRTPTLEEMCSLLESKQNEKRQHIDTLFHSKQTVCWTADYLESQQYVFTEYYIIDFSSGRVSKAGTHPTIQDDSFFLRAVRTAN